MDLFGLENSQEFAVSWWPKITDPIQAISPIWNTTRFFGTHVYRFQPATERPTLLELSLLVAITIMRIYMMYIIFVTDAWDLIFVSSSQLVEKGLDIVLKLPFVMMLFAPWLFLIRKPLFSHISRDAVIFDTLMARYNYPPNYQFFHMLSTILTMAAISIPVFSLAFIRGFEFWMDHFIVLTFVGFSWAGGLLLNTMCNVLLLHVLFRLEVINDLLRKNFISNCVQHNTSYARQLIKTVMRMHDKLSDISSDCSKCFAITVRENENCAVVITMLHVLASQLITTFAFIRVLFYRYDARELKDCIFYTIGTTSYCLLPIFTIWIAGHIKKRNIITWKLVHRIINTTDVIEVEDLLQQFSEQMNHRIPSVDFRFFDVDWPLLVKACSEACTYLIIMIQFETKQ
uniref:Gustatory receptor n=1 Tax=Anopheles epiroticus TaxID=199890 RepID=A0A182PR58_9DIPT